MSEPEDTPRPPADVGDGLQVSPGGWHFGGNMFQVYESHVRRSVPLYDEVHELAASLSSCFVEPNDRVYDLGCATGRSTLGLAARLPGVEIIGIDQEPQMVAAARRLASNVRFECEDIRSVELLPCAFVVLTYTLQFLQPEERTALLHRVSERLRPGGALFLAEKVKRRDPVEESWCQRVLVDFKRSRGFSDAQIEAKTSSLSGVLFPAFDDENVAALVAAGFGSIRQVFRHSCFEAWLAVK